MRLNVDDERTLAEPKLIFGDDEDLEC